MSMKRVRYVLGAVGMVPALGMVVPAGDATAAVTRPAEKPGQERIAGAQRGGVGGLRGGAQENGDIRQWPSPRSHHLLGIVRAFPVSLS